MAIHSFSNLKKIVFVLTIIILLTILKFLETKPNLEENFKSKRWAKQMESKPTRDPAVEFLKVFHLDLKGGPPKLSFLLKVLPVIHESGANAILIEYEDMFPYTGFIKNISARNAYPVDSIRKLVDFAESLNMEVIPLVQSFGHLEFVLKLEEFQGLRELEDFPQEICPMNEEAVTLIKEMIKQIMRVHKNSRYIHIGCDEVRHVGVCPRCSRMNSKKIFSDHVIKMASFIRDQYPGVTPLIWDDMLRRWTFNDFSNSRLGSAVEPVVWIYGNNIFTLVPPFVWTIYRRIFPRLWVASAFKGAFGEREIVPNLSRHFENNISWMKIFSREGEIIVKSEISGIFVTGWSRYDHFAVLCELLPVGIPSLVLSLVFLDPGLDGNHVDGFSKWLTLLRCPPGYLPSDVKNETFLQNKLGNCSFPGSDLYSGMIQFQKFRERARKVTEKLETGGWTSAYNFEKNFTSPWRLLELVPEEGFAGENLKKDISRWKISFLHLMEQYFDKYTTTEWEEQNIKPLENKLTKIRSNFQKLIRSKTWPRRPLR